MRKRRIISALLAGVMVVGAGQAWAATVHYNDSSVTGNAEEWNSYVAGWDTLANDYTQVSLTPGCAATEVNFAWYNEGTEGSPVVYFGTDAQNMQAYNGTSSTVDSSLTGGKAYCYNYVTVTGLQENTTYYYAVSKGGVVGPTETYKTGDFDSVNILYVGDPQVGASKGQPQGSETLKEGGQKRRLCLGPHPGHRCCPEPQLKLHDLRRRPGEQHRQRQGGGVCGLSVRQRFKEPAHSHHHRQP